MRVVVDFEWDEPGEVRLSDIGRLAIPGVPKTAGVYRFRIHPSARIETYIGQAKLLNRRMRSYVGTHTGPTCSRIREVLLLHLLSGNDVSCSIALPAVIEINGEMITPDMSVGHVRLLIENAALAAAINAGEHVHNL